MKGMDIFCASQAATAIRLSNMDNENDPQGSSLSSSSTTIHLGGSGGRAIDRYNPIIRDPRRLGKTIPRHHIIPSSCSSQSQLEPISPVPLLHSHQNYHNIKKVTIPKDSSLEPKKEKSDEDNRTSTAHNKKKKKIINRGSLEITESPTQSQEEKRKGNGPELAHNDFPNRNARTSNFAPSTRKSSSFTSNISPAGSSRYLLSSNRNQTAFFNVISDSDPVLKLETEEASKSHPPATTLPKHEPSACDVKSSSSSGSTSDQVVVLRVSLHCKGCERKMRKHISRMDGVSSFNIDFAAKKVTVVGNVTPLAVLASVSKVKNAQLLTPAATVAVTHHTRSSSETGKNNPNQAPTATILSS